MGFFSRKPANDSKARIEELKKKIQAEQAAYVAANTPPQPVQPVAEPVPPPAPVPQYVPPVAPPPPPVPAYVPPPAPVAVPAVPQYRQEQYERPRTQYRDILEEDTMEEIKTGIILDLGDGISLNLPIRTRMRLDEFLHIADKVRELQRLQR
jgi:hypothetical protein